jgi:predicted amidophosphoribosyltransferase
VRCPACGRFIRKDAPCSYCWEDRGFVAFITYDPLWKRILKFLKRFWRLF